MKYQEFEKKPFGAISLLAIILSWALYIYLFIDICMANPEGLILILLFKLLCMAIVQLLIVAFGDDESVVASLYKKFWIILDKSVYFIGTSFVELVFRRYYLKLYNLLNGLNKLEEVMERKSKQFKEENDKLSNNK